MSTSDKSVVPTAPQGQWSANSLALLGLTAVLSAAAEMFFKQGALMTAHLPSAARWFGVSALASWWVWPGMLLQILGMGFYAAVLRKLPLYVAFSFMSILHVLIPVGSLLFFHEQISLARWSGIALVLAGIWIIARPASKIEEGIEREL
jgi:drug/metabolite transporter (DMT)-like permease